MLTSLVARVGCCKEETVVVLFARGVAMIDGACDWECCCSFAKETLLYRHSSRASICMELATLQRYSRSHVPGGQDNESSIIVILTSAVCVE